MPNKPWEGRSVWCSGSSSKTEKGWLEVREVDVERLIIIVRLLDMQDSQILMTRAEAKTFAAQLRNLANRDRP